MIAMYKHVQISHMLVRPDICGQQEEFKQLTSQLMTQISAIARRVYLQVNKCLSY